ncbi:MAG: zinc-dependent alcohol dehydrogenase family protein [Chloroflexi bacterium]|nr:zinc-dependent alcohol dehydrogenase family protein [Chloroflexota bacterium]
MEHVGQEQRITTQTRVGACVRTGPTEHATASQETDDLNAMVLVRARRAEESPLERVEVETPTPAGSQIRIAVHACGVCHTDLHTVEGEIALPKLPVIPGHEIVGVVDQVGASVTRFKVGDRVGVPWLNWTDGTCDYCKRGQENLCEHARFTGQHVDGGYAEYTLVDENFAYRIPDVFNDVQAAPLLCAGAVGYRALRLSDLAKGERLGLYGFGASGHVVMQVARHWGCPVYVFTRGEAHRRLARELGAVWTGGAEETPPEPIERAIIFAPVGGLVREALRVMRRGGTVAHAGIYSTPIPQIDYDLLYHERTIRSVANSTRRDVEEFLQIAAEIPIRSEVETFALDDANRALQMMKASRLRGAGVLKITPD